MSNLLHRALEPTHLTNSSPILKEPPTEEILISIVLLELNSLPPQLIDLSLSFSVLKSDIQTFFLELFSDLFQSR